MEELQKAIENITYYSRKFPKEELELIGANRDEAIPYLRDAVEKAVKEKDDLDENYSLHLYGIFLLAQFQDREFFPNLMELASLPEDTLDFLIGDVLTEDLGSILYNTYNGEIDLLKQAIKNKEVSDYARSQMLDVMGQLYLDQKLDKQEWQVFLKEIVHGKSIGDYIYTAITSMICGCHLTDMIPELRSLYLDGQVDEYIGRYDEKVDRMFTYGKAGERFCTSSVSAIKSLRGWPMYEKSASDSVNEDEEDAASIEDKLDGKLDSIRDLFGGAGSVEQRRVVKIGRNDPCPCGSGKKYKQCCLKKSEPSADGTESKQEQEKWLATYPTIDGEREEGRVYLEDLYDSESIELDKLLYLALKHRRIPLRSKEPELVVARRKRVYLTDAYKKFAAIVEREQIQNFSEYDSKHSIHYLCDEWLGELVDLLEEEDRDGLLKDVRATCKKMGTK